MEDALNASQLFRWLRDRGDFEDRMTLVANELRTLVHGVDSCVDRGIADTVVRSTLR
jgi:hypothetical protein